MKDIEWRQGTALPISVRATRCRTGRAALAACLLAASSFLDMARAEDGGSVPSGEGALVDPAAAAAAGEEGMRSQDMSATAAWDGVALVHELLRLDAEAALAAERERAGPMLRAGRAMTLPAGPRGGNGEPSRFLPAAGPEPGLDETRGGPGIRLHAIYGTGLRLHAELSVGGQRYLYRAGRRLPVGMPTQAGETVPELERITVACVALRRDGRMERHCVDRPGAAR